MLRHAELLELPTAEQIMSMPALQPIRWTLDDVERLVDERDGLAPRYELVGGDLVVTPAPTWRHQRIVLELATLLRSYLSRHRLGEVFLAPAELKLATGQRFEPDLFVVPAIDGRRPSAEVGLVTPLLVCEALSPGSARHDRVTKRRAFQENRVPTYWIVNGDAATFEIWTPADERASLVDDRVRWAPAGAAEAFELDVRAFFASVADDAPLP